MYVFFQEETSLEEYLQKKPETKAQPYMYILLLGGTRSNPRQVFTILENQALKMPSVTQAVDFAFKLSCILDLQYQPQCFAAVAVLWRCLQFAKHCDGNRHNRQLHSWLSKLLQRVLKSYILEQLMLFY